MPVWGPHHNDIHLDTFEPVDAVHPRALDRHLASERHAERGEKSDSVCKVINDDADVVQSLDRHVPSSTVSTLHAKYRQLFPISADLRSSVAHGFAVEILLEPCVNFLIPVAAVLAFKNPVVLVRPDDQFARNAQP